MSGPYEGVTAYALADMQRELAKPATPAQPAPDADLSAILADVRVHREAEAGSLAAKLSLTRRVGSWQRRAR